MDARCVLVGVLVLSGVPASAQTPEDNTEYEEIIITGSPLNRSVDEAIAGVSVLAGNELAARLAGNLGETLKAEPGISSTYFGAGASRPIIRGQGGDRVRVLINGIGSIDASSASPDHAVAAEPAQAERVEVLRGAALLRYGSSGSGGIINVIDGRISDRLPDGVDGAIRIGASSVDNGREVAAALDTALGAHIVLHLDGTVRESDDFRIPGQAESARLRALEDEEHDEEDEIFGRAENSAAKTVSVTTGLSYVGHRGFLGAAFHKFNADYGVPGEHGHEDEEDEEEEEHGAENITISLDQTRVDVNGALEMSGFFEKLQLFSGYADYTHTEFEGPGVVGTVFTNEGWEARFEAIQAEKQGWRAAYGVQMRNREFSALGDEAFIPPTNTTQIGVYTFHEKAIGDLHLEAAARYENTDQEDTIPGTSRTFDLFSISGGGDIHLSDTVRIGGTVFRTERAPTTEELFSNGPHLATSQFEIGNPDLGKETAAGVEIAFRHRTDSYFLTTNLFYTDYTDFIFDAITGAEMDGLPVFAFTAEDASFKGFEAQAGTDIGTLGPFEMKLDALAEFVSARTETGNLPRIPPLSFLAGIEAENDRYKLRAELDHATAQETQTALEIPTDSYTLVNVLAVVKLPTDMADVKVNIAVNNLFNEDARQHTSFLKDILPLPGRNIKFSVNASF